MKIKEIIFDAKEPTSYCESFVYEPTNFEEEKLGHLLMLGRIRNVPENSFYLINLLASRIKREYYKTSHKSQNEAVEEALKEGNRVLKETEERIDWLGNLDFFISSVSQSKIYFTLLGKVKSFILRQNEVVDLVNDLILEKDFLFPFSTIIQANLKKDDVLLISTSNIFTKEKLLAAGNVLLPVEEKKIKKFIDANENGVALMAETSKTSEAIERLEPQVSQKKSPELKIPRVKISFEKISILTGKFLNIAKRIKKNFSKIPSLFKKQKPEVKEEIPRIAVEKFSPEETDWRKPGKIALKEKFILLIFILILTASGFGIYNFQKNKEIKAVETTIETAKNKKSEGENAMIYGDKEKAMTLFEEALNILNSIENPPTKQKTQIDDLKSGIENKISEALGRKVISQISPLFEIEKEKWNASQISLNKDKIYISSENSNLIYEWDISKKEGAFTTLNLEKVLAQASIQEKMLFLLSPASLLTEGETKNIELKSAYEDVAISEVDSYGNYFYIFDTKEGEIIKYELKGKSVSDPTLWFKERKAAKNAISMAIDGSVYLAFADGNIKKFSAGELKEEIKPPKTYPEIKGLTKIFTTKDNQYLYLLEPSEKRIIIINKKGEKISEYQFPELNELKDIRASSDDKNIYLLSDNKIFLIEIKN